MDYLESWENRDINNPYMLAHNNEKAYEIMETFMQEIDPKLRYKKAKQIEAGLNKLLTAIQDIE